MLYSMRELTHRLFVPLVTSDGGEVIEAGRALLLGCSGKCGSGYEPEN